MNFQLPLIAPSILAADFSELGSNIQDAIEGA
ncbi:MAG TPA: ribulose-phosphate 3-epimerase, partial [Balneolaceae bacterium]|nr:ribulose-phosphate 3-epimerase [Balneolaceae bacterium]